MRLIDADELKKKLNFVYDCTYIESKSKEGIASDIIDEIDNATTYNQVGHIMATAEGFITNPDWNKSDLISRKILKSFEYINKGNFNTVEGIREWIDAAPIVDLKDIYQEGYYDGHLEGYTKATNEKRPQGEWKLKIQRPYYIFDRKYYYCSNCNSEIHYSDLAHNCPIFSNFCPNCGADMRGNK